MKKLLSNADVFTLKRKERNKGKFYLAGIILRENDIIYEFLWQFQF